MLNYKIYKEENVKSRFLSKKTLITNAIVLVAFNLAMAQRTVVVSASEADAKIMVDGRNLGTGTLKVKVPRDACVNIKIQKPGFLRYEQTYCSKRNETPPPRTQYFDMKKDDAEEASMKTDQANVDFEVEVKRNMEISDVWKLANQIVTDYFDAIESSDKETSYLRTAWSVQSFAQNTIRTRLIIKLGKSSPLTFKVKLVSEYSGESNTSVKADERFHEWDRVLRKYQNTIGDFQNRLASK